MIIRHRARKTPKPIIARHDLGLDALGYGFLLEAVGFGAVGGAALLPRLRRQLPATSPRKW